MRNTPVMMIGLLLVGIVRGIAAEPDVKNTNENWIARFQQFAAQNELQIESRYGYSGKAGRSCRRFLPRTLPEPKEWVGLRGAFESKLAAGSATQAADRSRLDAGKWLITYLLGDRGAVESELNTALPSSEVKNTRATFALGRLKESLSKPQGDGRPDPKQQAGLFEQQIRMLEPVDEAALKRAVGGEENFKRLGHLMTGWREMTVKSEQIYAEWTKTKDDAVAEKKIAALSEEFGTQFGDDQKALTPYTNDPALMAYMRKEYQDQAGEAGSEHAESLLVPDLIAGVGYDAARALLQRAFRVFATLVVTKMRRADPMCQLAREMALDEMKNVKVPSWALVNDVHSGVLFEALLKKFPQPDSKHHEYRTACGFYIAGLVVEDRVGEAVKLAVQLQQGAEDDNEYGVAIRDHGGS